MENTKEYWIEQVDKNPDVIFKYNGELSDQPGAFSEVLSYALKKGLTITDTKLKKGGYRVEQNYELGVYAISINPKYVKYFASTGDELFILAIEKGYKPNLFDLLKNRRLSNSKSFMEYLIRKNPSNVKYVSYQTLDLIDLAIELGYKPKIRDLLKNETLGESDKIIDILIEKDPNVIVYYYGTNVDLIKKAISKGYKPKIQDLNNNATLGRCDEMIEPLLDEDVNVIKQYRGINERIFQLAYEKGFTEEKIIETLKNDKNAYNYMHYTGSYIARSSFLMRKVLDHDINLFNYYMNDGRDYYSEINDYNAVPKPIDYELVKYAYSKGFVPNIDFIRRFKDTAELMIYLINDDPINTIDMMGLTTESIQRILLTKIKDGYVPSEKVIEYFESINLSIITTDLIKNNPQIIKYYRGDDVELFRYMIENRYIDIDMLKAIDKPFLLYLYAKENNDLTCVNQFTDDKYNYVRSILSTSGFNFTLDNLESDVIPRYSYGSKPDNDDIEMLILFDLVKNSTSEQCVNFIIRCGDYRSNFIKYIIDNKLDDNQSELIIALANYPHDKKLFIERIDDFYDFLEMYIGISRSTFNQYGLNNSLDYLPIIIKMLDSGKLIDFIDTYDYITENFYKNVNDISTIKNLLNFIRCYDSYPDLLKDIIDKKVVPDDKMDDLFALFNTNVLLKPELVPKSIDDLDNMRDKMLLSFKETIASIPKVQDNAKYYKDNICSVLFGMNAASATHLINIYGGRLGLRQLIFENKNNPDIVKEILDAMVLISFIEDVLNMNDVEQLYNLAINTIDNFDQAMDQRFLYDGLNDRLRVLYEHELNANLTAINFAENHDEIINKSMTEETGIETIDLSDKKYCLLFHVKSPRETMENLVNGVSSPEQNTICMSIGSQRNLSLYYSARHGIILATDMLPDGTFIRSSDSNMGSNGTIKNNSIEDSGSNVDRRQKGALGTSIAPSGHNSEVFAFREDVKFKYIVLPGGRKPTSDELSCAKELGLKFVIVQELDKTINNPKEIPQTCLIPKSYSNENINSDSLTVKMPQNDTGPRRIAIFADSHGLFEPTLAILEDARKKGISEIYSLGDNIGTGPNPSDVMDLLEQYGVKSIKGNHEGYAIDGIEQYMDHLMKKNAVEEARRNSEWTHDMLTEEQKQRIAEMPESIQIEIGNKLLYLTHHINDFNTDERRKIPELVDKIIQGHEHFKGESDEILTLRGAGIGLSSPEEKGKAYYIIITENPDGTYSIDEQNVEYNYESILHDINESTMAIEDKNKIINWAGVNR